MKDLEKIKAAKESLMNEVGEVIPQNYWRNMEGGAFEISRLPEGKEFVFGTPVFNGAEAPKNAGDPDYRGLKLPVIGMKGYGIGARTPKASAYPMDKEFNKGSFTTSKREKSLGRLFLVGEPINPQFQHLSYEDAMWSLVGCTCTAKKVQGRVTAFNKEGYKPDSTFEELNDLTSVKDFWQITIVNEAE